MPPRPTGCRPASTSASLPPPRIASAVSVDVRLTTTDTAVGVNFGQPLRNDVATDPPSA